MEMKMYQKQVASICSLLLALLLFSACNGLGGKPADKNVLLEQRLNSYIEARKKNDLGKLRQLYLEPENVKKGNIVVIESTIVAISIADSGLQADTKIENKIQAMGFTFNKVPLLLKWSWKNDNWYIKPSQSAANPFLKKKPSEKTDTVTKEKQ